MTPETIDLKIENQTDPERNREITLPTMARAIAVMIQEMAWSLGANHLSRVTIRRGDRTVLDLTTQAEAIHWTYEQLCFGWLMATGQQLEKAFPGGVHDAAFTELMEKATSFEMKLPPEWKLFMTKLEKAKDDRVKLTVKIDELKLNVEVDDES